MKSVSPAVRADIVARVRAGQSDVAIAAALGMREHHVGLVGRASGAKSDMSAKRVARVLAGEIAPSVDADFQALADRRHAEADAWEKAFFARHGFAPRAQARWREIVFRATYPKQPGLTPIQSAMIGAVQALVDHGFADAAVLEFADRWQDALPSGWKPRTGRKS